MIIWELWVRAGESTFLPKDHHQKDWLTKGHTLEWTFEAEDYNDAMAQYHVYCGFAPYRPIPEEEGEKRMAFLIGGKNESN